MNPNKKVLNLRGEEMPKSLPTQKELDALPKKKIVIKDGKGNQIEKEVPDQSKLERETIGNIILNCLSNYLINDRKEGFYVNMIAQSIIGAKGEIELKDKLQKFLIEVLDEMIMRKDITKDEKGKEVESVKGLYAGWSVSQVLQELGIKE